MSEIIANMRSSIIADSINEIQMEFGQKVGGK